MSRAALPRSAPEPSLPLSVWVRLLKAHALILREARRRVPAGLTLPQFDVLAQLHRRPEGMTHGALGRELLVTAGNLTGIVRRLAADGLLERERVPGDRRSVRLRLTPRGRTLMARAIPRHRQELDALMAALPPADLARLRDLLGRLAHTVGEAAPAPARRRPRPAPILLETH